MILHYKNSLCRQDVQFQDTMRSYEDDGDSVATPPGTPPESSQRRLRSKRARQRCRSSSTSSSDENVSRRKRKRSVRFSKKELLKIFSNWKGESNKNTFNNSNFNNVIPEFDPSNKAQTIKSWLRKVNECAVIYGWDDKQTIHFSLQKLVGLAKRWFEALPTVIYSWTEWQEKLLKAFPSEENFGRLLEEMLHRTSRSDESLKEYFYDKLGLINRCEIVGRKAVDCIIYGISDKSIRNTAQALNCKEPEDLLNFLSSQKQQTFTNVKPRERPWNRSSVGSNITAGNSNNYSSVVCYNCQSKGHPFYKCPKPLVKCRRCKRIGHDHDDCKLDVLRTTNVSVDKSESNTERNTLKIDTVGKGNEKYLKSVLVNDKSFQAYIDFGSECTLMKRSDADSLQLVKNFENVPVIKGFGQSTVAPLYRSTANVKVDEVESCIEVLVVEDNQMQNSLIIGQNFTELPCVTVLKNYHKLTFYETPCQNPFVNTNTHQSVKLFIANSIIISNICIVPVYTNTNYMGDVIVEGFQATEPNREYSLFKGAYRITGGKGEVVISNLSHNSIRLEKDTLIARSTPFNEEKICQVNRITKDITSLDPLNKGEIKTGSDLKEEHLDRLYSLLQNYRDCFATKLEEVGCALDTEMKIDLIGNKPIVYRPYRLSHFEREKVRETIDELLRNDIIQESRSDYASPILMVKKKNGEQRLCVDFRALNNKTVKDRFPLPLIEDQISNLSGNSYFSTLDLASGYYQIPMAVESQHLTAFVTPDGHYEFKRMPFGLANAPAVFQRKINRMLGNRRFEYALAYLDDVLIPSKTTEEMFSRLEELLKLFRDHGLTLKLSKCRFFDTTVNYLGYDISSNGIQPGEAKIQAVKEFPIPCNVREIQQFLGLTNYFRKFIQGYGEIARPLTALLRKEASWKWTEVEQRAFSLLRDKLVSRPVLALYDPTLETELHTDASSLGVGGILMQWQRDNRVLKPVAYFSRQTTPEERHLHSYELETLAVVCSLQKFRVYLLGIHFKIYTDCAALRTTLTKRDLVPRIARWWLQITEYTFDIEYRPGVQMSHVDALSRNTKLSVEPGDNLSVNIYSIEKENWLLTLQVADPDISRIHKILKPEDDQECKEIREKYVVKNQAVYRKVDDRLCLVIPRSARWQICRANHDEIGHLGYAKTLEKIKLQYWFPKLRKFVKKYVAACLECAYNKDTAAKQKTGFLHPIQKIDIPFHTVHMDHLGPFVKSKSGNSYILTVVDAFTKYAFAKPVKDLKTRTTIKVLENIFSDFGIPARIVSDRGTSFTSVAFKTFCDKHGIKHVLNAVACPRANGQAERFNQTILNSLAAQNASGHEREWDKCLGKVQWGINNTVNASTQKTPAVALFGVNMRDALSNKLDGEINPVINNSDINEIRSEVSENISKMQTRSKARHDAERAPATKYEIGDLVKILRNNYDNDKKSTKLLSKFIGPYKVTEILGNDRYRIDEVPGFNKKGKPYSTVIAFDRMRPWIHVRSLEVHDTDSGASSDQNDEE